MKKKLTLFFALCLLLVVGVYFKRLEDPSDFERQKVAAIHFVDALRSRDVDKILLYSKDLRMPNQEQRRQFMENEIRNDPILDAGIAAYQWDGRGNAYAAVWFETKQYRKRQANFPFIKDNGRWKLLLGEDDLIITSFGN